MWSYPIINCHQINFIYFLERWSCRQILWFTFAIFLLFFFLTLNIYEIFVYMHFKIEVNHTERVWLVNQSCEICFVALKKIIYSGSKARRRDDKKVGFFHFICLSFKHAINTIGNEAQPPYMYFHFKIAW